MTYVYSFFCSIAWLKNMLNEAETIKCKGRWILRTYIRAKLQRLNCSTVFLKVRQNVKRNDLDCEVSFPFIASDYNHAYALILQDCE